MSRYALLLALLLCIAAPLVEANPPLEVVGLFKNRAVVRSVAGEELIRVGETSAGGVQLIASDAKSARVRYRGETYRLTLSTRVNSSFQEAQRHSVSLNPDATNSYRVRGAINDHYTNFLIDTGANVVAMSSEHAQRIGLDYRVGQRGEVVTAQGVQAAYFVTLSKVNVGSISAQAVDAAVLEGKFPVEVLLGMSFLSQVDMSNVGGVLTLSEKR